MWQEGTDEAEIRRPVGARVIEAGRADLKDRPRGIDMDVEDAAMIGRQAFARAQLVEDGHRFRVAALQERTVFSTCW